MESNDARMGHDQPAAADETTPTSAKTERAPQQEAPQAASSADASLIDDQKKRILELEAQLKDKDAKYLYLYADFENYKKRSIKERSDLIKFGWEPVARDLLQSVDDLERALAHIPAGTDKTLVQGLTMIFNHFKSTLQKQGVQTIECLEKEFDPNLHEAIGQEASELPSGTVSKEHTRGYTLHGRLLRPARVMVSGGRSSDTG